MTKVEEPVQNRILFVSGIAQITGLMGFIRKQLCPSSQTVLYHLQGLLFDDLQRAAKALTVEILGEAPCPVRLVQRPPSWLTPQGLTSVLQSLNKEPPHIELKNQACKLKAVTTHALRGLCTEEST